jgi:thiosulfate dehydrogenase
MKKTPFELGQISKITNAVIALAVITLMLISSMTVSLIIGPERLQTLFSTEVIQVDTLVVLPDSWKAPNIATLDAGALSEQIKYGRDLITHTSEYLGPKGKVMSISNGMNCQNCHLEAGTKLFGNNYSAVASTYPKFRARSGTQESIEKRVNDCIERSLNGKPLAHDSREMRSIVAYIKWVGSSVPKGESPKGSGLVEVPFLDQAADSAKGKLLYTEKCSVCHGKNGEGIIAPEGSSWTYPPLWGENSYNDGAGLYRISRFAGYIKANMPLGATYLNPQLSDEESWHLAAYVNSMSRPKKDLRNDWPDISKKPIDHPYGPFTDGFEESQHKFGPFKPILEKRNELSRR